MTETNRRSEHKQEEIFQFSAVCSDKCKHSDSDEDEENKKLEMKVKKMKSSFLKHDLILVVERERIYLNRSELCEKSAVFKAMLSADFKEKDLEEIVLPGKEIRTFLMFLRCTLSGYNDELDEDNIHEVLPLAHEYQVESLLDAIEKYLVKYYENKTYGRMKSAIIIKYLLEAEKYNLTQVFDLLIDFASRKAYQFFSKAEGFHQISEEILHKIAMNRWKKFIKEDGNINLNSYLAEAVK